MKVESVPSQKLNAFSRTKKTGSKGEGGAFLSEVEDTPYTASLKEAEVAASSEVTDILQLQEVTQPLFPLKRSQLRGEEILKILDKIRLSSLGGNLEKSEMLRLRQSLATAPIPSQDQKLNEIVQEIEQRLAVELAKIEVAENERI